MSLASQPLSEREAKVDLVLIQRPFLMEIMLQKYQFAKEKHDLHNKAGRVVSKQGQLQPRFHL